MKLTAEITAELRRAVNEAGGARKFSRLCGIDVANISRYLSGKVRSVNDDNWAKLVRMLPATAMGEGHRENAVIANTPELRERIKDAMMKRGLRTADELRRLIGYDSVGSIERLLSGKLNFFPEVLSAIFDALDIDPDDAPLPPSERELLAPRGIYNSGALLIRPIPVVDWANAAGHLSRLVSCGGAVSEKWDPDSTETVPAPVGTRRDTQAFRVAGASMEPTINDGDILLVKPVAAVEEIPQHKIVVAKLAVADAEDQVVCKRFSRSGKTLHLDSDNPAGRNWRISARELEWIGVVVRKISDL